MDKEQKIRFSVLESDTKGSYEYEENVYGGAQIVSYGTDNDAPVIFRNCYRNSATLGAIINAYIDYILGEEIEVKGTFAEKVNRNGMTMRQLIAALALDYEIYGGYAIQVIYNKLGTPVELFPMDFSKLRTNEDGSKIFYSKKGWTKYATKSEAYDRFNLSKIDPAKPTQIFYYKGDFTRTVYPLPPYFSALNDIMTEIGCSRYSLNSVNNGFSAKYILNFPEADNLSDTQKKDIETAIKTKFCGPEADSNFMLYWGDSEQNMTVSKIESDDAPAQYINIKENCRSNIYTAMRTNPLLCGLNQQTGFATQEFSDSFKLFSKTVIAPIQKSLKENIEKIIGKDTITITPINISFE